ncbi:thiol-disulfide oxidoreductase [compost metagenome]
MKQFLLTVITILTTLIAQSQTINIDLNRFGGKGYKYVVAQGAKFDTIAKGKLNKEGKTTIVFKDRYKAYKGMSRFLLDDGGGLELVINKENFTVRCTGEVLTADNLQFTGSPENVYLADHSIKKQKLLQKAQIAGTVLITYNAADAVYAPFEKEQQQLNEQYKVLKNVNSKSPLYAAGLIEIFDFLMGNSSDLKDSNEKKMEEANTFVLSKVNMDDLYASGYWTDVWNSWLQLQLMQSKDDAKLLSNLEQAGSRINDKTQFTAFAEQTVLQLAKVGKDNAVNSFGDYLSKSGKIENPRHNLLAAMGGPQTGMKAPDLVWKEGNYSFDKKQKTLLVFYETGCNNCDNEINLLIGNYQELQKKGYEVVTAASDVDPAEYQKNADRFPWKKKFSDFRGQAGYNFISFGVIGTPTIFVIDENGIITGRYARLADANILN